MIALSVAELLSSGVEAKTPIPLDGNSATILNFGQNDTNRSRNGKSVVEAKKKCL